MDRLPTDETVAAVVPLPAELANHPDYEIVRRLGGGTMPVFLARNRLMGRHEVLKIIGPEIIGRPGVRDHFLREIRSVAKLRHPNIVTAYSGFRAGESLVFAMEYAEGLDLARLVKASGPLSIAHAVLVRLPGGARLAARASGRTRPPRHRSRATSCSPAKGTGRSSRCSTSGWPRPAVSKGASASSAWPSINREAATAGDPSRPPAR